MDAGIDVAKAAPSRAVALKLLGNIRRRDARAREVLRSNDDLVRLSSRDRALAMRLIMGVQGAVGLLDQVIDGHLRRPHLEPKVRDALRIGAYELMFLSTPSSVAVSQSVELARMASPRVVGLANAVLRKVSAVDVPARHSAYERAKVGKASLEDLVLVSGYPLWLLRRVAASRGMELVLQIALSATEPAPIYVRANEALGAGEDVEQILHDAGLKPRQTEVEGAFELLEPAGLASTGLVDSAQVVVSDLSAQRVATMAAPSNDARMLEVGQGRGTKTLLLLGAARRAGAQLWITGIDSERFKTEVARERMQRAGVGSFVRCLTFDACELSRGDACEELAGKFDAVLVDAPCSGTGTMRRHPEAVWKLRPENLDSICKLQLQMLRAASSRVAPGASLFYSTCSVLSCENERVVQEFLQSDEGMLFDPVGQPLSTYPALDGPDGHFCAQLVRRSNKE